MSVVATIVISRISTIEITMRILVYSSPELRLRHKHSLLNHDSLEPNLKGLRIRHHVTLTGNTYFLEYSLCLLDFLCLWFVSSVYMLNRALCLCYVYNMSVVTAIIISTIKITITILVYSSPELRVRHKHSFSNHNSLQPNPEGVRIRHYVTLTGNTFGTLGRYVTSIKDHRGMDVI